MKKVLITGNNGQDKSNLPNYMFIQIYDGLKGTIEYLEKNYTVVRKNG